MSDLQTPTARAKSWLDAALIEADRSNRWLAEQIGASTAQVSRFRNGLRPSSEMRRRIAKALRTSQKELWP